MVNKVRLYWSLQIGGWAIYAIAQIVAVLARDEGTLSNQRIIFLLYEAAFCLTVSHIYRNLINRWKWLSLTLPRLIPRVLFSVFVMGVVMYFLRVPVSIPLGLPNKNVVFDPLVLLGLSFVYAIFFFNTCVRLRRSNFFGEKIDLQNNRPDVRLIFFRKQSKGLLKGRSMNKLG